jgi:predicted dinucleotide-binding enzyme
MKIAIIGSGNVGQSLAKAFLKGRHEIRFGSRDPSKVKAPKGVGAGSAKEAAGWSDLTVLAVPYGARKEVIDHIAPGTLKGKVLLDVTNAIGPDMGYAASCTTSSGEEVAAMAPGASVVKAFNTVFAQNMPEGNVGGEPLALFVAGDDAAAKEAVMKLGSEIGFEPVDAGGLKNSRLLEAMAIQIINLGYVQGLGPGIGYRLARAKK